MTWHFQLKYNLLLIFDFEYIINVRHREKIYYKWYLLCSFDESTLIEILKVCLLWSLWLHHLQCICIILIEIKIFCFRVTFGTLFIISTLNTVVRLFKWEEIEGAEYKLTLSTTLAHLSHSAFAKVLRC